MHREFEQDIVHLNMETTVQKKNATVAVIGAGDFIGGEIAKKFASEGFTIFAGRRNGAKLEPLVKEIEAAGGEIHARSLDARKEEEITSFLNDADKHAPLEVCVFNIGANVNFPILETTERVFRKVWEMACYSGFLAGREAARLMTSQAYGRIITVASRAWQGNPGQANYSAAKAGVVGLTKSVAKELGRHGVTANAIAPGLIETASLRELATFDQIAERAIRDNSIKRIGQPDDVAAAVLYLASPQAGFITGEVIHVSGGRFG